MVHDPTDSAKAHLLSRMFDDESPRPFGVLYQSQRPTYETALQNQIEHAQELQGEGDLDFAHRGKNTWTV
ncbi:MAG: hypothetical protein U5L96_19530 [Owenweeksia sp.]|nr:hypothetical protein [Owenweeksia sp.]